MNFRVVPRVKDGEAYAAYTSNQTCDQCYNGKHLLPFRILDAVARWMISNAIGCEDSASIGNCSSGTADNEEGLQAIGADIGDEAFGQAVEQDRTSGNNEKDLRDVGVKLRRIDGPAFAEPVTQEDQMGEEPSGPTNERKQVI